MTDAHNTYPQARFPIRSVFSQGRRYLISLSFVTGLAVASSALPLAGATSPASPTGFPNAETHVYRELTAEPLRLHVMKPAGWKTTDRRPALIYFFGGAWTRGTPEKSIGWAKLAADWGMVGVAPDYRTKERFDTTPVESVADARAAVRWVQDHASELGLDPERIVIGGSSAGGHLALWASITKAPYGSTEAESPRFRPVALLLQSAAGDLSDPSLTRRFGPHVGEVSPLQFLDDQMPPILMFHGDADKTVPYSTAVALHAKLTANGNVCEFITVPGGSHGFSSDQPDWKIKVRTMIVDFLTRQKILPVVVAPAAKS